MLEGEAARRFIREAKANEKKRGIQTTTEDWQKAFEAKMDEARKKGVQSFSLD